MSKLRLPGLIELGNDGADLRKSSALSKPAGSRSLKRQALLARSENGQIEGRAPPFQCEDRDRARSVARVSGDFTRIKGNAALQEVKLDFFRILGKELQLDLRVRPGRSLQHGSGQ